MVGELDRVALGRSAIEPKRGDRRFTDPVGLEYTIRVVTGVIGAKGGRGRHTITASPLDRGDRLPKAQRSGHRNPHAGMVLEAPRPATVADGLAVTRGSDPVIDVARRVRAERHNLVSVDPQSREPPEGAPRAAKRRTWSTSANGASCLLRMTNVTDSMCRVQRIR
jgi:hypothetical protein